MANHLRSMLQAVNLVTDGLEQAVNLVTNDNLDLGCAVIEKAATEKVRCRLVGFSCNLLTPQVWSRSVCTYGLEDLAFSMKLECSAILEPGLGCDVFW
jgi:CCR4-NOT transcription complex subunit 1